MGPLSDEYLHYKSDDFFCSIAISGNVADFLQKSVAMDDHKWHYDFHKVTKTIRKGGTLLYILTSQVSLAATAVFSYASILPASLYGFLWWAGGSGARCVL